MVEARAADGRGVAAMSPRRRPSTRSRRGTFAEPIAAVYWRWRVTYSPTVRAEAHAAKRGRLAPERRAWVLMWRAAAAL